MSFGSNVAPPKIPLRPKPRPWTCWCVGAECESAYLAKLNPGYLARCPVCKSDRPKEA